MPRQPGAAQPGWHGVRRGGRADQATPTPAATTPTPAPAPAESSNLPWIIGGVIALLGAGSLFVWWRRRR